MRIEVKVVPTEPDNRRIVPWLEARSAALLFWLSTPWAGN